jgi:hypothetical protein
MIELGQISLSRIYILRKVTITVSKLEFGSIQESIADLETTSRSNDYLNICVSFLQYFKNFSAAPLPPSDVLLSPLVISSGNSEILPQATTYPPLLSPLSCGENEA